MLNFFYLYAGIFAGVIFLYNLGWADINAELDIYLSIFLWFTIVFSLLLGWITRRYFRFVRLENYKRKSRIVTFAIIGFTIIDFIYCKQIPLFNILSGTSGYTDFEGIPTLHALVVMFTTFYSTYIIYLFICFPKKKSLLVEFFIFTGIQLLYFTRSQVLINLFLATIITLAAYKDRMRFKYIASAMVGVLIIFYLFGGLGNLRQGYEWNDSLLIKSLSRFNDEKYPDWLPEEYVWSYVYITSPLSNLNHNIINSTNRSIDLQKYIFNFVPDVLGKRIDFEQAEPKLVINSLNATMGYAYGYLSGGFAGMYIMYFYLFVNYLIILKIMQSVKIYYIPTLALISMMAVFLFFVNTLENSIFSFPLAFPLLAFITRIYPRYKYKQGREY